MTAVWPAVFEKFRPQEESGRKGDQCGGDWETGRATNHVAPLYGASMPGLPIVSVDPSGKLQLLGYFCQRSEVLRATCAKKAALRSKNTCATLF